MTEPKYQQRRPHVPSFGIVNALFLLIGGVGLVAIFASAKFPDVFYDAGRLSAYIVGTTLFAGLLNSCLPREPRRLFEITPLVSSHVGMRVFNASLIVALLALLYSTYEVFVPTLPTVWIASSASFLAGIALGTYTSGVQAVSDGKVSLAFRRGLPFMGFLAGFVFGQCLFLVTTPAIYTRLLGHGFSEVETLAVHKSSSTRGGYRLFFCGNTYLKGGSLDDAELLFSGACFSLPRNAVVGNQHRYRLEGLKSPLGTVYLSGSPLSEEQRSD